MIIIIEMPNGDKIIQSQPDYDVIPIVRANIQKEDKVNLGLYPVKLEDIHEH